MHLAILLHLPLLYATLVVADWRLHHRVISPKNPSTPFTLRGTVYTTTAGVSITPTDTLERDIASLVQQSRHLDDAVYQVALERRGDTSQEAWAISPIKLVRIYHYHLLTCNN